MDHQSHPSFIHPLVMIVLLVMGFFLLTLEWFLPSHGKWFWGFYAIFGFIAYCFVIGCAYLLRLVVSRPEESTKRQLQSANTSKERPQDVETL